MPKRKVSYLLYFYILLIFFSKRYGTNIDYVLPSLLSSIGLFCGLSSIKMFNSSTAPIFYTCLAAQPSTGKTKALRLVTKAITAVERYNNVDDMKSKQVNAPTVEGLVGWLKEFQCIIGKYFLLYRVPK